MTALNSKSHLTHVVSKLADAGVAVMARLGLHQSVAVYGGYRCRGPTAEEAEDIVALALQMEHAGAAAILLEAVPPEVARGRYRGDRYVPVIGCGAGPRVTDVSS